MTRMQTTNGQLATLIGYSTNGEGYSIATVQFDGEDHCEDVLLADINEVPNDQHRLMKAVKRLDLSCTADLLNPCYDNRPGDVAGLHWDGITEACPQCSLRATLAAIETHS